MSPTRNMSLARSICIIDPQQLFDPCDSLKLSIPVPVDVLAVVEVDASASERVDDSTSTEASTPASASAVYRTSAFVVAKVDAIAAISSLSSSSSQLSFNERNADLPIFSSCFGMRPRSRKELEDHVYARLYGCLEKLWPSFIILLS